MPTTRQSIDGNCAQHPSHAEKADEPQTPFADRFPPHPLLAGPLAAFGVAKTQRASMRLWGQSAAHSSWQAGALQQLHRRLGNHQFSRWIDSQQDQAGGVRAGAVSGRVQSLRNRALRSDQWETEAEAIAETLSPPSGPAQFESQAARKPGRSGTSDGVRGGKLGEGLRGPLERAFGYGFDRVRVHTDERADRLNRMLNARAFTRGSDLFFRRGEFDPSHPRGYKLLAHELAHVVQQAGSGMPIVQCYRLTDVDSRDLSDQDFFVALMDAGYRWRDLTATYRANPEILQKLAAWRSRKLDRLFAYLRDKHGEIPVTNTSSEDRPGEVEILIHAAEGKGSEVLHDLRQLSRKVFGSFEIEAGLGIHPYVPELPSEYRGQRQELAQRELELRNLRRSRKRHGFLGSAQQQEKKRIESRLVELSSDRGRTAELLFAEWKYRRAWLDKTELEILAEYQYDWFKLKQDLAYRKPEETESDYEFKLAAMARMVIFRERVVGRSGDHADGLLGETKHAIESLYRSQMPDLRVKPKAFGSTAPTSDYDITFEIPGYPEIEPEAVAYFNATFRNRYGVSSGMMFDTNVYTTGFIPQVSGPEIRDKSKFGSRTEAEKQLVQEPKIRKHRLQMALSFVAIRQYFGRQADAESRWSSFKQGTKSELSGYLTRASQGGAAGSSPFPLKFAVPVVAESNLVTEAVADLDAIFNLTDQLYDQTEQAIAAETAEQEIDPRLLGRVQQETGGDASLALHRETQAKEKLYVETLRECSEIQRQIKEHDSALDDLDSGIVASGSDESERHQLLLERALKVTEFIEAQGMALIYANEAYFSAGSAVHVVLQRQAGLDVQLRNQKKMQSLLMNVGYKLQHFRRAAEDHGIGRALIDSAKYGERVSDLALARNVRSSAADQRLAGELSDMAKDILRTDEELLRRYKKEDLRYLSPSEKESAAIHAFASLSAEQFESAYLEIAQKALGPYYWEKHFASSRGIWSSSRRGSVDVSAYLANRRRSSGVLSLPGLGSPASSSSRRSSGVSLVSPGSESSGPDWSASRRDSDQRGVTTNLSALQERLAQVARSISITVHDSEQEED